MRYIYYLVFALFAYFVLVQYNDPDPLIWMAAYSFPIYLVYQNMKGKISGKTLVLVAIPYIFWAINQFPPAWEGLLLNEMGMKTINIELGRESLGLGITALILLLLSLRKIEK
ncbi:MAG: transmembrane 220 family protein [Cytophagaceae bacterium]|nr:transmembrane 220 family protein [Cytophagaceae bacterium]